MQLLCHLVGVWCRSGLGSRSAGLLLPGVLTGSLMLGLPAQAQAQPGQTKLLNEVSLWVQQTQQLKPEQFSFAPMDSRVQLQSCDRALLMDLPFASRETVRVRCLGPASWQLYLRLVYSPGFNPVLHSGLAPVTTSPGTSSAQSTAQSVRKVVVGKFLLRAGTMLSPDLLTEVEHSVQGLDSQAVSSVKDLDHGEMVRDVPAGVPLRSHDVRRAVLVKHGQTVLLSVGEAGGYAITARVEALQDGRMGEQVRLKNPESGRFLSGIVTGPNAARGL
ncbi:MAG: flagellar basal body P-ring formation chaperone FlgA [Burkholderiaceae bacterium]